MYQPSAMNNYYDIGTLTHEHVSPRDVEVAVKYGPKPYPKGFPEPSFSSFYSKTQIAK